MNKELLLKSAEIMDNLDPKIYNQSDWFTRPKFERKDPETGLPEGFCGTAACWLGHMAISPEIPGIQVMDRGESHPNPDYRYYAGNGNPSQSSGQIASKVFDIPYEHVMEMVGSMANRPGGFFWYASDAGVASPTKMVASAIRNYVETNGEIMDQFEAERRRTNR